MVYQSHIEVFELAKYSCIFPNSTWFSL